MTTNKVDVLLGRIPDPHLRGLLAAEIDTLRSTKKFGLVFEDHLPETVRLPSCQVRRGALVQAHDDVAGPLMTVIRVNDGVATLVDADQVKHIEATRDLVVVRPCGQPVYPGLSVVDRIERGGDKPHHLVINAENHHALEALAFTHTGKVDVIYIDPPYNTGSGDFTYNDKRVGADDTYRHSKWLSFMDRRLRLAHTLLKPTGVIFISIDDHEQARLKLLCDQVFGAANFVDTIMLELSRTQGMKVRAAKNGAIVKNGEFVHVYRRSAAFDEVTHTPLYDGVPGYPPRYSLWLNADMTFESLWPFLVRNEAVRAEAERFSLLSKQGSLDADRLGLLIPLSDTVKQFIIGNADRILMSDRGVEPDTQPAGGFTPGRAYDLVAGKRRYLMMKSEGGPLRQLIRLSSSYRLSDDYIPTVGRTVIRGDMWKGFYSDMVAVSAEGAMEFKNGKKPIRLIRQLIRWANNSPDAVILDFFAGSGTTAHAVMEMNAADDGRRQSIVVTNNEVDSKVEKSLTKRGLRDGNREWENEGIFCRVTKPRVATVATGVREDGSRYSDGLAENVTFMEMTYEDRDAITLNRAFAAIAPLLWVKAGAVGPIIDKLAPGAGCPAGATYAVLSDVSAWRELTETLADRPEVTSVFVVTDSDSTFSQILRELSGVTVHRLYGDYLANFEINTTASYAQPVKAAE